MGSKLRQINALGVLRGNGPGKEVGLMPQRVGLFPRQETPRLRAAAFLALGRGLGISGKRREQAAGTEHDDFRNALKGSPDGDDPGWIQNGSKRDALKTALLVNEWCASPSPRTSGLCSERRPSLSSLSRRSGYRRTKPVNIATRCFGSS